MAGNYSRQAPNRKMVPVDEAKSRVIAAIADGLKVREAMLIVDRKEETYKSWMKDDADFRRQIEGIRSAHKETARTGRPEVPDFDVFCRDWLKQPLFPHQLRMWDAIEGREPRDLHDSMTFREGDPQRVLINVPIEHAKSTTFTVNYSVWRIHKDPDVRIVIVSQARQLAMDFLYEIKLKLTSPLYREMHMRFGPTDGWKDPDGSWTTDRIYVKGKGTTIEGVQKDPTVQAMGLSGTIYGKRADLIILDDIVSTKNVNEIEKQMKLINRDIDSRLPSDHEGGGLLAVLGTRIAPRDIYRELIDVHDGDDVPVWTYFRQPAVLDYGDGDSKSWVTLWPEKWPGKSLAKKKHNAAAWNLIYQQLNVDDNMTFKSEAVEASIERRRFPGLLTKAGMGHRDDGMDGLYLVGGLDPATVGATAMVVVGLDPQTEKRYVLDGFNKVGCSPAEMRDAIKRFTDVYGLHEWIIERNAFQRFLTQDPDLTAFLRSRGCHLREHYTTANKFDSEFGIATMGPLFDSCGVPDPKAPSGKWRRTPDTALIELPSERQNKWVSELVQELCTWQPQGLSQKTKTDLVMALWFCEIGVKDKLKRMKKRTFTHVPNPWLSPSAKSRQKVINLADLRREKQLEAVGG